MYDYDKELEVLQTLSRALCEAGVNPEYTEEDDTISEDTYMLNEESSSENRRMVVSLMKLCKAMIVCEIIQILFGEDC